MTVQSYKIRCCSATHTVTMDDEGHLVFGAHPDIFSEIDRERAVAVLSGAPPPESEGCMRIALLVRAGALSSAVQGGDDGRRLLAALRGIRVARKLRRRVEEQKP